MSFPQLKTSYPDAPCLFCGNTTKARYVFFKNGKATTKPQVKELAVCDVCANREPGSVRTKVRRLVENYGHTELRDWLYSIPGFRYED